MKVAEKIMIAFLLISEGADEQDVSEFLEALSEGIAKQESDAIIIYGGIMKRLDSDLPGMTGAVVRLMKAKIHLDETFRRFGLAMSGMNKVVTILQSSPQSDMASKIILKKALNSISEVKSLSML